MKIKQHIATAIVAGISISASSIVIAGDSYKYAKDCPSKAGNNDDYGFYKCNCTSYVADKIASKSDPKFKNVMTTVTDKWSTASNWKDVATKNGYISDGTPKEGDIAWWGISKSSPSGHVAYVESLNADGSITISEYNNPAGSFTYKERKLTKAEKADSYIRKNVVASDLTVKCSPTTLNESGTSNTSICTATKSGNAEIASWSIINGASAASIDTKGNVKALSVNADTAVTVQANSTASSATTDLTVLNSSPQNGDNPLKSITSVCAADDSSLTTNLNSVNQDSITLELRHSNACGASWARVTNSGTATNINAKVTLDKASYNLVPNSTWTYMVMDKSSKAKASASYSYTFTKNGKKTTENRIIADISKK